jgi:hypothetical protein
MFSRKTISPIVAEIMKKAISTIDERANTDYKKREKEKQNMMINQIIKNELTKKI